MTTKIYPILGLFLSILLFSTLSAQGTPSVIIEDKTVQFGDIVEFDVLVENYADIISATFSVEWDSVQLRYVRIDNIALDLSIDDSFGTTGASGGKVNYLYFDNSLTGNSLGNNTALFTVVLEVVAPESTTTNITFGESLEVVDTSEVDLNAIFVEGVVDIVVMVDATEELESGGLSSTVSPNPFNKDAQVQLQIPIAGDLSWTLTNLGGQKISEGEEYFQSGKQLLTLPNILFKHSGSYILKLEMEGVSISKRLIYLEQ